VKGGTLPLVSVRASQPIPKNLLPQAVAEITKARTTAPVKTGDIIIKNILGTGADIIATRDVPKNRLKYRHVLINIRWTRIKQ